MLGKKVITLKFSMNWLVLIPFIGVALVVSFYYFDQHRPILVFTAAVLAGTAALLAAVNAVDARRSKTEQSRKMASLEYIRRWTDPTFHHAKKNGREMMKEFAAKKTEDEKRAYLEGDATKLGNLIDILNVFESMSVALQEEIIDEQVAKRFFRSMVLQYWHCSEQLVKTRRSERSNSRIFCELEWLFNRWKD